MPYRAAPCNNKKEALCQTLSRWCCKVLTVVLRRHDAAQLVLHYSAVPPNVVVLHSAERPMMSFVYECPKKYFERQSENLENSRPL